MWIRFNLYGVSRLNVPKHLKVDADFTDAVNTERMSTPITKSMNPELIKITDSSLRPQPVVTDDSWRCELSLDIVTDLIELERYGSEWDRLLFDDPRPVPMSGIDWLLPYFSHRLLPNEHWVCLIARRGQRLAGIMPVLYRREHRLFRPYTIVRTPYDSHTYGVDILTDRQQSDEVIEFLIKGLAKQCPDWGELHVVRLADSSPLVNCLPNGRGLVGTIHEPCDGESVLFTRGLYEDYFHSLSRNFRRALRKATKKLDQLSGVHFSAATGLDAIEAWRAFVDIDSSSWRAAHGDDLLSNPSLACSHRKTIERLAAKNITRVYLLFADGKPIAGLVGFALGHTLAVKKVAHREEYSHYSPGNMLFEYVLQQAYADPEIQCVNCLTDMSWHRNWNMTTRPNRHLWIYRNRPVSMITGFYPRRVKQWLHYVPGLTWLARHLRLSRS